MLNTFSNAQWNQVLNDQEKNLAIKSLESGNILFFPNLKFEASDDETRFLSPEFINPSAKNISYHALQHRLWGVQHLSDDDHLELKSLLHRFSQHALQLIGEILPSYSKHLNIGRTSLRPVQISTRKSSPRKDDKRLHIDAFPSAPNQGKRILRVFTNINPNHEARIWRVGEPFERVAIRYAPRIPKPIAGFSHLLRLLRITKSYRTAYDYYMLRIHDLMKSDDEYQRFVPQETISFPSGSTWIVQTDQVSHAAMKGQFLLEQTFYLPVSAMLDESKAPLRVLEKILRRPLV